MSKYLGNQRPGFNSGIQPETISILPSISTPHVITTTSDDKEYVNESGAENQLIGPGIGSFSEAVADSEAKHIVSGTGGSAVSVDGETIRIVNSAGAGIIIDPDGSVYIIATGKKGLGLVSSMGPIGTNSKRFVIDGGERLELKADDITTRVAKDFTVLSEGSVSVKTKNFQQDIAGSYSNIIEGDRTDITGGINREVVAGEKWTQVSSFYKIDTNDSFTLRSRAESSFNFEDNVYFYTNKNYTLNAGEQVNSLSGTTTTVQSKEKMSFNSETSMETTSKEDMTTTSNQKMTISSKSDMGIHTDTKSIMTASDTFEIGSDGNMKLTSSTGNLTAYGSSGAIYSSGGRTEVTAENTLQLNYSLTRAPDNPGETGEDKTPIDGISSVDSNDASDTEDIKEASPVETLGTGDIIPLISDIVDRPIYSSEENTRLFPKHFSPEVESILSEHGED